MNEPQPVFGRVWLIYAITCLLLGSGCQALSTTSMGPQEDLVDVLRQRPAEFGPGSVVLGPDGSPLEPLAGGPVNPLPPVELSKMSLPMYRIEPPDVLLIDAVRMAPKSPYEIMTLDWLEIMVVGTLPEEPINRAYQVSPDGTVHLGASYGMVSVAGMSLTESIEVIEKRLRATLRDPQVSVSLAQMAGQQQIAGEHLVAPDGTVNLGVHGSVYVAGMTLAEARQAIEEHLSQFLDKPKIAVDVFAYNSKVYYIITEGAGLGDNVFRFPVVGGETVLDAMAQVGGLSQLSSKRMWIARPAPGGVQCWQILPIEWDAIAKGGATATNYQLLPGDRLYVAADRIVTLDNVIGKLTRPFERLFGGTLLGAQTIQVLQRFPGGSLF